MKPVSASDSPFGPIAASIFSIGGRQIGAGQPVFVIAEVGINHHGDANLCARMIEAAVEAGADAVKLTIVDVEESYASDTVSNAVFRDTALDDSALRSLMALAHRLGTILFSTPGDFASLDQMSRVGMPAVKVSSGLMTNQPLIAEAARRGMPMIISTGLAYENEIARAIETALQHGSPGIAILKCTSLYPAPDETINISGMQSLARRFGVPVGYSDHTLDGLACYAAVALGATVIEKHFTLDKQMAGADHHISMNPGEFENMVTQIRRISVLRGHGRIEPAPAEEAVRSQLHRCLVARKPIGAGELFSPANVGLKRPPHGFVGLPPSTYDMVLGKTARVAIGVDQVICGPDVEGL